MMPLMLLDLGNCVVALAEVVESDGNDTNQTRSKLTATLGEPARDTSSKRLCVGEGLVKSKIPL